MTELAPDTDESAVVGAAASNGVGVLGAARYCEKVRLPPALVLGYGAIAERLIPAGVERLAAVIRGR